MSPDALHPLVQAWYDHFLKAWIEHPDTEEIAVNRAQRSDTDADTVLWLKSRSRAVWTPYRTPLTERDLVLFMTIVANVKQVPFHEAHNPWLFEAVHHRFSGVAGPFVRFHKQDDGGAAIAMRQDRRAADTYDLPAPLTMPELDVADRLARLEPAFREVAESVRADGRGVLFTGEMGAGKTYRLHQIHEVLGPSKRYLFVEDTREIDTVHPNSVPLYVPRNDPAAAAKYNNVLLFGVRSTGNVLLVGEQNRTVARQLPDLATAGWHCVLSTTHGGSAVDGCLRLRSLMGGTEMPVDEFWRLMRSIFGWVVHCSGNGDPERPRRLAEIRRVEDVEAEARREAA